MTERFYNVLFLCTGNSAVGPGRRHPAQGRRGPFHSLLSGQPAEGTVNPLALKVLGDHGYPIDGYRSKSWAEFAAPGAPVIDFVLIVCDSAAGEACPGSPGHPSIAHWAIDEPAAVEGSDADNEQTFIRAFEFLKSRIDTFVRLPGAPLDRFGMGTRIQAIGHLEAAGRTPSRGTDLHQR